MLATDPSSSTEPLSGPERKRQRLMEAAAESFATLGYAKTTIEDIARAAGVSKGLLYVHFRSKEELLEAVLERTLSDWSASTQPDVERQTTVRGALETMHESSIAYAAAQPLLRRILVQDALLIRSVVGELAGKALEDWLESLQELFETGRANGELRPDLDVRSAAHSYALLHLSFLDRLTGWEDVVSDPELISSAMTFLLDGMKPGASS